MYPPKFKPYRNLEKLITNYRQKKILWEIFFTELRVIFFKDKVYNKKTFRYDVDKNFKLIDDLFKDKVLVAKEYKEINIFRNSVVNTYYPLDVFVMAVRKGNFKLVERFHDKPFRFFKYFYVMAFKKL